VPWVGCAEELVFYELHPGNGSVTGTVPVEVEPYGAAAGGGAWIWVAGQSSTAGPGIQRFDAVMGGLDPVVVVPEGCGPEGIAVDSSGAVWVGTRNRQVCRYSPAEAAWTQVAVQWPQSYGVSVAADGVVWVANYDPTHAALSYFPAADPSTVTHVTVPGSSPYAVSADGFGYVWTANYAGNSLTRYTVADGSTAEYPVGRGPSAYSDFTGLQRTIIATSGTWHADFERCAVAEGDRWGVVRWDAETTGTSSVTLSAATAATATELDTAVPVTLVTIPPGSLTPVDIEAAFAAASIASGAHLRLTATLTAGAEGESPVLRTVDVQWHCAGEG
jgi:streptogramin lyase